MTLAERIDGFAQLGQKFQRLTAEELGFLTDNVRHENAWFTPENTTMALQGLSKFLDKGVLEKWSGNYSIKNSAKKVGVAMAGNIPLVGFHDLLCVLIAGHHLVAKLSTQDSVLMNFVKDCLVEINPQFANTLSYQERLHDLDGIIATGSDNTSRYFEYYFRNIPHIIRKNRTSCAVILGEESSDEFRELGKDIFSYFGLGCRNVSKVYVPEGFDFVPLIKSWESFQPIIHHHKYVNNYDYQKSILLVNQTHFYDSGFLLLTENQNLVSPVSTIFYEYYKDQPELTATLSAQDQKIQCIVSAKAWYKKSIPFGEAQYPHVDDYADGVDTLAFLTSL